MDEEMEEFVGEAFEGEEIDMDYEFDSPSFYDFTRPETDWEAEEAEDWFRYAGSYPPSPLIVKLLNCHKGIHHEATAKTSVVFKDVECIRSVSIESNNCMEAEVSSVEDDSKRGVKCSIQMDQDTPKAKTKSSIKSPSLSRSSTLMKPTASQLAKQNQHRREVREAHSNRVLRRIEKKLGKVPENSQNSPLFDSVATKRQKLEAGYLGKVAQLKHQPLWSHKAPKKVGAAVTSPNSRPKVTIPREPNLETAQRAQRRIRLMRKMENKRKLSRSLHGPSLKRVVHHKQKSFKCFISGHHRELNKAHLIMQQIRLFLVVYHQLKLKRLKNQTLSMPKVINAKRALLKRRHCQVKKKLLFSQIPNRKSDYQVQGN